MANVYYTLPEKGQSMMVLFSIFLSLISSDTIDFIEKAILFCF